MKLGIVLLILATLYMVETAELLWSYSIDLGLVFILIRIIGVSLLIWFGVRSIKQYRRERLKQNE